MNDDRDMKLLTDTPAGITEPDRFHHKGYSKILARILSSNPPGICVGLFGKWGQGKSTVVNLLEKAIPSDTTVVVFNAWKSRGDSVRRQMLLAIMEKICPPDEVREFKRFADIYVIQDLIRKAVDKKVAESAARKSILCDLWRDRTLLWPLWGAVVTLTLSIIFVIVAFLDGAHTDCWLQLGTAFFLPAFTGVAVYLVSRIRERYSVLIGNIEQISESQKIRYPEQFKDVFVEKVAGYLSAKTVRRLLVVVDDLDRCDPGTVIEALAAVRQFSDPALISKKAGDETKGCQFLIPCDEHQVLLALESDGYRPEKEGAQYHDYQKEELLRKFFDIVVRMDSYLDRELTEYAGDMAEAIGLNRDDTQELVDMVEPRDPRQVKNLLNAYKVTLARIQENQSVRLLPAYDYMPDHKRTVMMVVALKETVPSVYDLVAKDLSLLDEIRKPDYTLSSVSTDSLKDARRIVTRAGRTSTITGEYLVSGRYEKELRDVSEGGAFALAVKHGDDTAFATILNAAEDATRQALVLWLTHCVRRAPTVSRLTSHLNLCVVYASAGSQHRPVVFPTIDACAERGDLFQRALAGFTQLNLLSDLVPEMNPDTKVKLLQMVLDNFMSAPASRDADLRFLVHNATDMSQVQKDAFRDWIVGAVHEPDQNKQQTIVERLATCLPQDTTGCQGLAPEAGVHLAGCVGLDDKSETMRLPEQWPRSRLIPLLIGDDSVSAKTALDSLFANSAPLGNAVPITETTLAIRSFWCAAGALINVLSPTDIQGIFPQVQKWLNAQNGAYGVCVVLDALKQRFGHLDDVNLAVVAKSCAEWQWRSPKETKLCQYFAVEPDNQLTTDRRAMACRTFFKQYAGNLRGQPGLATEHKAILACFAEMVWPVNSEVDSFLAEKINQLPNGTQNIDAWAEGLAPLMGTASEKTKTAILNELKNRKQFVRDAMNVGRIVVWERELDEECARAIASVCCEQDNQVSNWRKELDSAIGLRNGARLIELVVGSLVPDLRTRGGHPQLMSFVGNWIHLAPSVCQTEWQQRIKPFLLSANEADILSGLDHIEKCTTLDSGVSGELAGLAKHKNSKIAEKSAKLLSQNSNNHP